MRNISGKTAYILLILLLGVSCGGNSRKHTNAGDNEDNKVQAERSAEIPGTEAAEESSGTTITSLKELLPATPVKPLPYRENMTFENHSSKAGAKLGDSLSDTLGLKAMFPEGSEFSADYRLALQAGIYTFAVSCFNGEFELFTTLINYDKEFNVIGKLLVASDEIAESIFRTESSIREDGIVVKEIRSVDGISEYRKAEYEVGLDGSFRQKGHRPVTIFSTEDLKDAWWLLPSDYPLVVRNAEGELYENPDPFVRLPNYNGFGVVITNDGNGDYDIYDLYIVKNGVIDLTAGLEFTPLWATINDEENNYTRRKFEIYEDYSLIRIDTEEAADGKVSTDTSYYFIDEEGDIKETVGVRYREETE